jgi:hypothetical protein
VREKQYIVALELQGSIPAKHSFEKNDFKVWDRFVAKRSNIFKNPSGEDIMHVQWTNLFPSFENLKTISWRKTHSIF